MMLNLTEKNVFSGADLARRSCVANLKCLPQRIFCPNIDHYTLHCMYIVQVNISQASLFHGGMGVTMLIILTLILRRESTLLIIINFRQYAWSLICFSLFIYCLSLYITWLSLISFDGKQQRILVIVYPWIFLLVHF